MAFIIDGIMTRKLPWGLVLLGVFIAVVMQLAGVPALAFAVGVYLPLSTSMPIFVGGLVRGLVDRIKRTPAEESDSSPAVLLSSGYIAGGAIAGILIAIVAVIPGASTLARPLPAPPDALERQPLAGPGRVRHDDADPLPGRPRRPVPRSPSRPPSSEGVTGREEDPVMDDRGSIAARRLAP